MPHEFEPHWIQNVVSLAIRKSRRALMRTAGDRGWDVAPGAPQWVPRTPLYLYLFETDNAQIITGVLNWEDLDEIAALFNQLSSDEVRSAILQLLSPNTGKPRTNVDDGRRRDTLVALNARYVAETETFHRIPRATKHVHVVTLVYRPNGKHHDSAILRPFALVAKTREGLLSPAELRHAVGNVVRQDRTKHPDWFTSAAILSFPTPPP